MSFLFDAEAPAGKKVAKAGSSSIQRSVETGMAVEFPRGGSAMNRQPSRESTDGSMNSYSSEGKYVHTAHVSTSYTCSAAFCNNSSILQFIKVALIH